jgi:hypothetical protein
MSDSQNKPVAASTKLLINPSKQSVLMDKLSDGNQIQYGGMPPSWMSSKAAYL